MSADEGGAQGRGWVWASPCNPLERQLAARRLHLQVRARMRECRCSAPPCFLDSFLHHRLPACRLEVLQSADLGQLKVKVVLVQVRRLA